VTKRQLPPEAEAHGFSLDDFLRALIKTQAAAVEPGLRRFRMEMKIRAGLLTIFLTTFRFRPE
jgi:hypothetical protein